MSSFDMFSSSGPAASGPAFQTEAVVKWFNQIKGFGFVAPADGSPDAFIHSSVVSRAGMTDMPEGTRLLVQIGDGQKGPQVLSILQNLGGGQAPQPAHDGFNSFNSFTSRPAARSFDHGGSFGDGGAETSLTGVVKWFKPDKGFGFVTPDDGGRDIFVHRTVVLRAGLQSLETGQKVRMAVQTAAKGREASSLDVIG